MSPYIPYTSTSTTTYYHCDSCKSMESGNFHKCYICQAILCPRCNMWGLCPEHFSRLSPQDQFELQVADRELARSESQKGSAGLAAGCLPGIFACVTFFLVIFIYSDNHPVAEYVMWSNIALWAMWGPTIPIIIWGLWKFYHMKVPIARATVGIIETLQRYPAFGPIDLGKKMTPTAAKELLRSRKLLPLDGSVSVVEKTSPMDVVKNPISYRGSTNKCWTCGAETYFKNIFGCSCCGAVVCQNCHKSGLCPDHYALLSPKQQGDLKTCYNDIETVKERMGRPGKKITPALLSIEAGYAIAIPAQIILKDPYSLAYIVGGIAAFVLGAIIIKLLTRRIEPDLDRAILTIQALFESKSSLAKVLPVYRGPFIPEREEEDSDVEPSTQKSFSTAIQTAQQVLYATQATRHQERPLVDEDTRAEWSDLIKFKVRSLCCPTCKIYYPGFARYCIFCGKTLLGND